MRRLFPLPQNHNFDRSAGPVLQFLCINPNTDPGITAKVARALAEFCPPDVALTEATGGFGAPYIAARATYAVGGHAALEAMGRHAQESIDAVLLACFGDPALAALREISAVPVIGMAEASCQAAAAEEGCFSIVTGGYAWREILQEFVMTIGLTNRMCSIRTTAMTGGDIFQAPDVAIASLLEEIARCKDDGAARVILGGAGLAGLADQLRPHSPLPIIDSVEAMARAGIAAVEADRRAGLAARSSPLAADLHSSGWLAAFVRL